MIILVRHLLNICYYMCSYWQNICCILYCKMVILLRKHILYVYLTWYIAVAAHIAHPVILFIVIHLQNQIIRKRIQTMFARYLNSKLIWLFRFCVSRCWIKLDVGWAGCYVKQNWIHFIGCIQTSRLTSNFQIYNIQPDLFLNLIFLELFWSFRFEGNSP